MTHNINISYSLYAIIIVYNYNKYVLLVFDAYSNTVYYGLQKEYTKFVIQNTNQKYKTVLTLNLNTLLYMYMYII